MKEVVYSDKRSFLLTNEEFKNAMLSWNQKNNYWCQRIEKLLSPFVLHAGTPDYEVGKKIYMLPLIDKDKVVKLREVFIAENGKYYEILDNSGKIMPVSDQEIKDKQLILKEDYYNNEKVKKIESIKKLK